MYHFIVNPASRSGKGKKIWEKLSKVLDEKEIPYEVHFSEFEGHTTDITSKLTNGLKEDLHLVVLGGDGTVNEVLQGIDNFDKVILSYIPTGSSNDFARDLKISSDPVKAFLKITEHPTKILMDLGHVHSENTIDHSISDKFFAVSCGVGFDAAVCQEANTSTTKKILNKLGLGKITYLAIALKQIIRSQYITATLTMEDTNDEISINKLLFLAGMNHKYEGGGFLFAPDASDTDGQHNICCVSNLSKWRIPFILPTAFSGNHYKFDGVDGYVTTGYTLKTSMPLWVHTDGEVKHQADIIEVKCVPGVVRLYY